MSREEVIQGVRLGDLIEPFAGRYEGIVRFNDEPAVELAMTVQDAPDSSYNVHMIRNCVPNRVYQDVTVHFASEDGILDHDFLGRLAMDIPEPNPLRAPEDVLYSQGGLPRREWGEELEGSVPIEPDRYEIPVIRFELEWKPAEHPVAGKLVFSGTPPETPATDTIAIATFSF